MSTENSNPTILPTPGLSQPLSSLDLSKEPNLSAHKEVEPGFKITELDLPPISPDRLCYPCICGGKPLDDWIACERKDCKVEWYHWECVGLVEEPKTLWVCPNCRVRERACRRGRLDALNDMMTLYHPRKKGDAWERSKQMRKRRGVAQKVTPVKKKGVAQKVIPEKKKPQWEGWEEVAEE